MLPNVPRTNNPSTLNQYLLDLVRELKRELARRPPLLEGTQYVGDTHPMVVLINGTQYEVGQEVIPPMAAASHNHDSMYLPLNSPHVQSGYFTIDPYNSSFDDGTRLQSFYDGNNRRWLIRARDGANNQLPVDLYLYGVEFRNREQADVNQDGVLYWDKSAGLYVKSSNAPNNDGDSALLWSSDNLTVGPGLTATYDTEDRPTLNLQDTGWQIPTLLNGWVETATAANGTVAYRKIDGNKLVFRGVVDGTSATANEIFTLPVDYRPAVRRVISWMNNSGDVNLLIVETNGDVRINSSGEATDIVYLSTGIAILD